MRAAAPARRPRPVAVERGLMTADEANALRADRRPAGDRAAKRRRLAQLRYLHVLDDAGPDDPRAIALAQEFAAATPAT